MGAIPNKLPGFQDVENDAAARARFEARLGRADPARATAGTSPQMFEAMERGELRALYVIGENPAQSEADTAARRKLLDGLDHLVVQDIFLTKTAEMADVVLPGHGHAGARPRARSPTASGGCSACARRSSRRARRATTS